MNRMVSEDTQPPSNSATSSSDTFRADNVLTCRRRGFGITDKLQSSMATDNGDFIKKIILLDQTKPIIRMANLQIKPKFRLSVRIRLKFILAERKQNCVETKP